MAWMGGLVSGARVAGSAALTLVTGQTPVRPEPALFDAMLAGWRSQQLSRRLTESMIGSRERTVRRFAAFTGGWPWSWTPGQLEEWIATGGWAHSTVRTYQGAVAIFLGTCATTGMAGSPSVSSGSAPVRRRSATSGTPPGTCPSTRGVRPGGR